MAAAASKRELQLLIASVGFGLLGYGSLKARRDLRRALTLSPTFPPETSLLDVKGFLPPGFRVGIEILNDDRTPMEFVVSVLRSTLGLSDVEAVKTMLEIHKKGGVLLPLQSVDEAKRVADLIVTAAREKNHPLVCRAVSKT
jgi:ATP-dependent Clp protease adapter protein ClpS